MVEFLLSGTNESVNTALDKLKEYVASECNTEYNSINMKCESDSLIVGGKSYSSQKVRNGNTE